MLYETRHCCCDVTSVQVRGSGSYFWHPWMQREGATPSSRQTSDASVNEERGAHMFGFYGLPRHSAVLWLIFLVDTKSIQVHISTDGACTAPRYGCPGTCRLLYLRIREEQRKTMSRSDDLQHLPLQRMSSCQRCEHPSRSSWGGRLGRPATIRQGHRPRHPLAVRRYRHAPPSHLAGQAGPEGRAQEQEVHLPPRPQPPRTSQLHESLQKGSACIVS